MKKMRVIILLMITNLFCYQTKAQCDKCLEENIGKIYGINDSLLVMWRNSQGVNKYKREMIFSSLFKKDSLIGIPRKAFLLMFGPPDEINTEGILGYKFYHYDKAGNPIKTEPYSEMLITFQNDRLTWLGQMTID